MSIRDDLSAAMDETPDENYDETVQEVITDETETADTGTETGQDIAGGEAAGELGDAGDSGADESGSEQTAAGGDAGGPEGAESVPAGDTKELGAGDSVKAPVGYSPKEREDWSKIPRHLQDKVVAREKELNTMLQTTADARRTHEAFDKLATTYGAALSGVVGDTPMEAVENLFSTVSNLRMGSPIQKAQIIANLISDFGVDINTLDSAIVGAAPSPGQQQNAAFEDALNKRMAPFEEMLGQQNAYKTQQANQRTTDATNEIRTFAETAEFLSDVREDMADLLEMAAARGADMTTQDAYDKACMLNPQIQSVLQQRAETLRLQGDTNTMAGKRKAASSITGRQVGSGGGSGAISMRDTIAAAWDGQNNV